MFQKPMAKVSVKWKVFAIRTIFAKGSIIDVEEGPKCVSETTECRDI